MVAMYLTAGDGSSPGDKVNLADATNCEVQPGSLSAPPARAGERWRVIEWVEMITGSSADNLWTRLQAIQTKLNQAKAAQGPYGHGTRVTLSIRPDGATNFVYADVVDGVIDIDPAALDPAMLSGNWLIGVPIAVLCEPYFRGDAVTTTVSGTITATAGTFATPGNSGSGGLFLADIPGDVPALARHIITDVSTGSTYINRLRIGEFSIPDPAAGVAQSAFTPWVDDTPAGAGSATSDATAVGSAGSRITLSSTMQRAASYAKPSAAYMTGLMDVWMRVKDSNAILGAPTLTGVGVDNDVNMYVRQTPSAAYSASASSLSPAWGSATRAGSLLLLAVSIKNRTTSITATGWTAGPTVAHGSLQLQIAWFYKEAAASESGTVSVSFGTAAECSAQLIEVVGAAASSAVDRQVTGTSTDASLTLASGALAQAREMVFTAVLQSSSVLNWSTGFTDATTVLAVNGQDMGVMYARATATTTQNVQAGLAVNADSAGALISVKQAANVAPNIPVGTYEVCVVAASAGGSTLSAASNVISVTVTQTDSVIWGEWDLGSGSPDHHRLYYRMPGGAWEYYGSPASTGTWTAYIVADDGGTAGDPPTITSNASNVRLAIALSSGTTVFTTPSVRTRVGGGNWEWLYVATVPLPPMPAIDGGSPRDWIVYAEASNPLSTGTLDVDVAVFVAHPIPTTDNRHYVVSEYSGLALAALRAHKVETRRDGRTFGYITATGGDTEAGQLDTRGESLIGPGDCWLTVIPDIAGGISDVVNSQYTHQVVYTPRFTWLRGT